MNMSTRLPGKFSETTAKLRKATAGLREADGEAWLYLPFPVSVNRAYRAVGGRVILSEAYRKWKALAAQELMLQKAPHFTGPVSVWIILRAPDKRKRDADNPLKAVLDCLVAYGVIDGDDNSIVRKISVRWDVGLGEPCVVYIAKR